MQEMDPSFKSEFNEKYSLVSRKILRALSENSRITISDLAKQLGLSRRTAKERLQRLEKEFGIQYTIELNEDKIGIVNPHIIMVKFSKKPDLKRLAVIFSRSTVPQMVAAVRGTYDLFIYANAQSRDTYVHWDKSMQVFLAEYGVSWQPSEVAHRQLGFYPIRNELLEKLDIPEKYKKMLTLLNLNGRASFQELSKKLGMHFNTVAYTFNKLIKLGYIKRFTLVMNKPENVTLMTHFGKYTISSSFEQDAKKERVVLKSDDEHSLVSRYILVNQLVGSFDWFGAGVFDNFETAYKKDVGYYKKLMGPNRPRIVYGVLDKIILGNLPIRSVDTNKEFNTIVWTPDFEKD